MVSRNMERKKLGWMFLACISLSGLTACGYYNEIKSPMPSPNASVGKEGTLGFTQIQSLLERNRCLQCHSGSAGAAGVDVSTYESTVANLARVRAAIMSNDMPMGGPPVSDADKAMLEAWIRSGAPEFGSNGGDSAPQNPGTPDAPPTPPAPPDSGAQIDFAMVRDKILVPMCVKL